MVPEDTGVHPQDVHHFLLDLSAVEVEIQSTLNGVAGIDQEHIRFRRSYAVYHGFAAHHTAEAVFARLYLRVSVVGV